MAVDDRGSMLAAPCGHRATSVGGNLWLCTGETLWRRDRQDRVSRVADPAGAARLLAKRVFQLTRELETGRV
jgi:hypothetical protein